MDCPVCGCCAGEPTGSSEILVECYCCGTVWLVEAKSKQLERVLVGPEG